MNLFICVPGNFRLRLFISFSCRPKEYTFLHPPPRAIVATMSVESNMNVKGQYELGEALRNDMRGVTLKYLYISVCVCVCWNVYGLFLSNSTQMFSVF